MEDYQDAPESTLVAALQQEDAAAFEYFVSLLDGDGNVLDKLSFPFTAKYWKNRYVVTERDAPVELSIPLTGGLTGDDFSIYVGFQLNREELDFNRGNIVQ